MALEMPGLSDAERSGCRKMLSVLRKGDLLSLSDTVTNKMISVENTTEALEAILSYTKDAEELLKRKKVQRDVIFRYLAGEAVVMPPHSEKHQLVKRTLELWASEKVTPSPPREPKETRLQPSAASSEVSEAETQTRPPAFDPSALGLQFCRWFFELLNSQNPSLGRPPQDWGPQHFWPDARLELRSSTDSQQKEDFQGAELVGLRLLSLARDEGLVLSPNLEPHGLRALASAHGPVLVAVAGTIHRGEACLGIFEQVFGLVRAPLEDDSWKIKFVKLKIRGQGALGGAEEDTASPALTCDSSELQLLCG